MLQEKGLLESAEAAGYDEAEEQKEKDIFFNIVVPNIE
jgi:hypothetical protein